MSTATQDIVAKLWNLCHVLRDDGITYHQYVTELTYLLFIKMAQETGTDHRIPEDYRWDTIAAKDGTDLLQHYRRALVDLSDEDETDSLIVREIYEGAATSIRKPKNLRKIVEEIDKLDWYSAREEGLGNLYEGLLEKNAQETKSGAGQYFTPRPLIDAMIRLTQPQPGEIVQDPALGTAGFLTQTHEYVKDQTDDLFDLDADDARFQKEEAYHGVELVPDTHRLALMNAMLHDIEATTSIHQGDTLGDVGAGLPQADVILTNPPFGSKKGGGTPPRDFTYPTSNKQLNFLQHIYNGLKPGGRAAVVLPDNVLFEDGTGQKVRRDLMDKCDLHTILRLPTGIFYARGLKANVLFFTRGDTDTGHTDAVWYYDMRTNMRTFGKTNPLKKEDFEDFEEKFGDDPDGRADRTDTGEDGRFRRYTREEIAERGDNLDISWLKDEDSISVEDLRDPEVVADEITELLAEASTEMDALNELISANGR
jgi:type I restriction enzyme M protein